ncbi:MAG: 16S rRNA (guanine(527)-N(7))-methyltransferase RsmG [Lachnospiraceae bacterium]|nr:16S rRNA (guanine(527)-N(7))-methyltransferase RsmG [Lachnospiraceae bacterium]
MEHIGDDIFLRGLDELGLEISPRQCEQFHVYYERMIEKNRVMNLTAITEYSEVVVKHWLDSLCIWKAALELPELRAILEVPDAQVIDVGTGAGFPGIPIKILFPQLRLTLLDSLNKRICFLQDVVDELKLDHVSCIHGRAEELARKEAYREKYDLSVSRAVAKLASLSELCLPFVKVGGIFLPYKTEEAREEIEGAEAAVKELGAKRLKNITFTVPQSDYKRSFPVIQKQTNTKAKYPRGGGKPLKSPLA